MDKKIRGLVVGKNMLVLNICIVIFLMVFSGLGAIIYAAISYGTYSNLAIWNSYINYSGLLGYISLILGLLLILRLNFIRLLLIYFCWWKIVVNTILDISICIYENTYIKEALRGSAFVEVVSIGLSAIFFIWIRYKIIQILNNPEVARWFDLDKRVYQWFRK